MGLKSRIRERVINAVQYAVREEMKNYNVSDSKEMEDRIVQRLDKQVERWTWERYQRTEKSLDTGSWNYYKKLQRDIDLLETNIQYEIDKNCIRDLSDDVSDKVVNLVSDKVVNLVSDKVVKKGNDVIKKVNDQTDRLIRKWTWERYLRVKKQEELLNYIQDDLADIRFSLRKNRFKDNEKVKIVLLYQMPSMWPSWESFYQSCEKDDRIEIKVLFLNELIGGKSRLENAEEFLKERNVPCTKFEDFDLENYHPHVLFIQTPYDESQRIRAHWSARIKSLGIRVCYIPYGIEITDMPEAHNEQYNTDGLINCWRIYTFSESIKREYFKHSLNGGAVRALGLPKFDSIYHKEQFKLNEEIIEKANGRKIILWKLHFPKAYKDNGKETLVTPDFEEYINFAKKMDMFENVFFVFMPHPLFREKCGDENRQKQALTLFSIVENCSNVYVDMADDYRNSLFNAQGIIIDRSAVMVEAGAVGVPVLFMSNPALIEPKPEAITPLIESYYQGNSAQDMISFVEMCSQNQDPKQEERSEAFNLCIPYFDGNCGERIKEDILFSLKAEEEEK